jgi:hypothetical protein
MAMNDQQEKFIEWLLMPKEARTARTQKDLAGVLGVGEQTLTKWKKDPEFIQAWEARYYEGIGDPGKKAEIMATLLETATDREDPKHVQAAKAYMEIEGSLRPTQQVEMTVRPLSELSDTELAKLAAMATEDELAKRREAS